jgi:hypothetical protein
MNENVLVAETVSRDKGEIMYKVDCSSNLTSEELEYYLEQVIGGICKWKPTVCEEAVKSFKGTIRKRRTKSNPKFRNFPKI